MRLNSTFDLMHVEASEIKQGDTLVLPAHGSEEGALFPVILVKSRRGTGGEPIVTIDSYVILGDGSEADVTLTLDATSRVQVGRKSPRKRVVVELSVPNDQVVGVKEIEERLVNAIAMRPNANWPNLDIKVHGFARD